MFFRGDWGPKRFHQGVPEGGGVPPSVMGVQRGALDPLPVGKSGGLTTLLNSLNISRNALFLRIGWSGTIRSYVKLYLLMVANFGRLMGSSDIILKGNHLRTIPTKFGPNWLSSFRGDFFQHFSHRVLLC